jgi:branched-subunit amino acid aminotransferase/4-amino-4-deoxychorismate lyase
MKVSGGAPLFLGKHLERLTRDASAIHLAAPVGEVEVACFGLAARLGLVDGVLKVVLTRAVALVGSRRGTSRDRASS